MSNMRLGLVLTAWKVTLNARDVDILGYRPSPVTTHVLTNSIR